MGVQKVLDAGQKTIRVLGPFPELAEEIVAVHAGFWNKTPADR